MHIIEALNVGTVFQNVAFYTFMVFLLSFNLDVLKFLRRQKENNSPFVN